MPRRKRLVLVGAGHAHLYTLKRAASFVERGHEVTLIAPDDFWYSGLATGMLGGWYPPELDRIAVGALVSRAGGLVQDYVTGIDTGGRTVTLGGGGALPYDALSLNRGSESDEVITAAGHSHPYDLFLNATGLRPHPLARAASLPVAADGAMIVDAHLRSPADPVVHGGGDAVAFEGCRLPQAGVYAIRQAPVLCANLLASLEGQAPTRFVPQQRYLWIMNLGDGTGLAARGSLWWMGRSAFWLKHWIDLRFLRRYR
jgi:NADH dehydrogenase FAD-containing subunit